MVLDTRQRREMFEQAVAAGSALSSPGSFARSALPFSARTDQKEYRLGRETDRDRAFEDGNRPAPRLVHAEYCGAVNKHEDGYYLGRGDLVPELTGPKSAR